MFKENEEDIIKGRRSNFFLKILLADLTSSHDSFIGYVIAWATCVFVVDLLASKHIMLARVELLVGPKSANNYQKCAEMCLKSA